MRPSPTTRPGPMPSTTCASAAAQGAQRVSDWRRENPPRAIAFEPPILRDGADAAEVVQVHLEHRLVRRLLSRFLVARLPVRPASRLRHPRQGRPAARRPPRPSRALRARRGAAARGDHAGHSHLDRGGAIARSRSSALGERGEETTLEQLEDAIREARPVPATVTARVHSAGQAGCRRPAPRRSKSAQPPRSSASPRSLPSAARPRLRRCRGFLRRSATASARPAAKATPDQYELFGEDERRQCEANRRHWAVRLQRLEHELREEPQRVRAVIRSTRPPPRADRAYLSLAGVGVASMARSLARRSRPRMARPRPARGPRVGTQPPEGAGAFARASDQGRRRRGRCPHRRRRPTGRPSATRGRSSTTSSAGSRPMSRARPAGRRCQMPSPSPCPTTTPRCPPPGPCAASRAKPPGSCSFAAKAAGVDPDSRGALGRLGGDAAPALRAPLARDQRARRRPRHRRRTAPRLRAAGRDLGLDLTFPLRPLATVAGRPMLGGLKLLLGSLPPLRRRRPTAGCPALLREQPRGAGRGLDRRSPSRCWARCTSCLRGLDAAEPKLIAGACRKAAPNISTRACSRC